MPGVFLPSGRIMQLILRDDNGNNVITLDIGGPNMSGQGICLLSGWSGMIHAPRTPTRESWAYQEGSTVSNTPRVDERIIDLRLATKGNSALEWETIDGLLWRVLGFKHDAILRVFSADGINYRDLKVRLDRKPADDQTIDTAVLRYMIWNITLVASDPWWYSNTIEVEWLKSANIPTIILQNPADQECWVQWAGPTINVAETWRLPDAIGVYPTGHPSAGQRIQHTLPQLTPGQEFLVQTNPLVETLEVRSGAQKWAEMKAEEFTYSLPPGQAPIALPISLTGGNTASKITAFLTQRWDRPFGPGAFDLPMVGPMVGVGL